MDDWLQFQYSFNDLSKAIDDYIDKLNAINSKLVPRDYHIHCLKLLKLDVQRGKELIGRTLAVEKQSDGSQLLQDPKKIKWELSPWEAPHDVA